MSKIFRAVVNCDASASATVFVKAENTNKAPLAVLDIASELPYTLTLNTPYAPEFWLETGEGQVIEVDFKTPASLFEFQALEDDALLAWPENAVQPHTKADFLDAASNNPEWAYTLYDAYINDDGDVCLNTYLEQTELKDIIFGSESNYQQLARALESADLVKVDDSPLLSNWAESFVENIPDNQIYHFKWTDDEAQMFSCTLTEANVKNGEWKGNKFICEDHEGNETTIEFFTLTPIKPFGELTCTEE